ncbi:hypothetical protein J4E90_008482 [Alternaria incomplexa]|uniref:uncharacterized protein n=1 Tax=Alternaria incomplexa TaxID=1187928 RepID=UPI00221ED58C|nr:uncharacterized protein J4E90_008482 [Alternaria incomplexa]KAI4908747.1 hypothetical protein J4E90_008482 [Alternaria incomplexa]
MNGQPIPGYFWDAEKKKYFRIQNQTAAQGSNLKYSSANIKKTERKERIQNVALARSNKLKKERVVRRNPNSFAQTNIDREIGLRRRSRYVHGLWPDACAAGIEQRPEKVLPPCGLRLFAKDPVHHTIYTVQDGTVRLYDTRSGGSSHVLTHPAPISKLKRADDETRLICSGLNDTLFLYDIRAPRLSRNSSRKTFDYDNHHYNEEYFKSLYPTHRDSHKRRKLNHKAFKNWSQPVMTFAHLNRDELELDIDVYPRLGLLAAAQDTTEGTVIRISNIWTGKSVKEIDPGSTRQAKIRALKFVESGFDGNVDLWSCWGGGIAKFGWSHSRGL